MAGAAGQDLIVFTKAYDFTVWAMNHTVKFPKSARFSVAARLENRLLDLIEAIVAANQARDKNPELAAADSALGSIRILVRLSKDMRFINIRSYEHAAGRLDKIGRLIGGWIRRQRRTS